MEGSIEMGIGGLSVPPGTHICGLFRGTAERDDLQLAFLQAGLVAGEKCVSVVDGADRETQLAGLAENVDVEAVLAAGQLEVLSSGQAYSGSPVFTPADVIEFWERSVKEALGPGGFSATRAFGEMTTAQRELIDRDEWLTYESELNRFVPRYPQVLLCLYNLDDFSGGQLVEILKTHPLVLMGGTVLENLYFVPPDEALAARA